MSFGGSSAIAQTGGPGAEPLEVSVSYTYQYHHSGCPVPYPCETATRSVSFAGTTTLYAVSGGFRGNGTGMFSYTDDIQVEPYMHCPDGDSHHMATNGISDFRVNYMFSIDNDVTGGPDTSLYNSSYGVVEVIIEDHDLRTDIRHEICGEVREDYSHNEGSAGYDCHFYSLDFEDGASFTIPDQDDPLGTCGLTIGPVEEVIDVMVEPEEIFLKYNLDQTAVEEKPKAKVTVTLTMGGSPVKDKAVMIKVCTLPGTTSTDGHIGHDPRAAGWEKTWDTSCDQGERPFAVLTDSMGRKGNILVKRTDGNGQIILDYTPPLSEYQGKHPKYHYVAGKDEITATAIHKAPTLNDKATVIAKVRDLIRMPGSVDNNSCSGQSGGNYTFSPQGGSKHGCIFFGTAESNQALQRISDEFMRRQQACANNQTGAECLVEYQGSLYKVTINGAPQKIQINAMGLPWGGITDNVKQILWFPPHLSHNDGRQVDLSFAIYLKNKSSNNPLCSNLGNTCNKYDVDRILMLREVVAESQNFYRFPSDEGGDLKKTFGAKQPHIHIFFRR
jgi:hypothetical protein